MIRYLILLALLTGCGSDNEAAIKTMADLCEKPLRGTLTIGGWGNTLDLHCDQFKHKPVKS